MVSGMNQARPSCVRERMSLPSTPLVLLALLVLPACATAETVRDSSSPRAAERAAVPPPLAALPDLPDGDVSVRWQVKHKSPASRQVTIAASTGCEEDPPVQVAETAEVVVIRVVIPSALDPYFCSAAAVERTITLASPLGVRRLQPAPLDAG